MYIVAPSRGLADCLRESALMRDWPVSVVGNPLNTSVWRPVDKALARDVLDLPQDCLLVGFGTVRHQHDENKGLSLLSGRIDVLLRERGDVQLVIAGNMQPSGRSWEKRPVHYMGRLYDDISLRVFYSAVDAVVVPSRYEAFGQIASEAQACGTPVVAFDNSGIKDIVQHKQTGWLARAFDMEELAYGIEWIIQDPGRREKLGQRARRNIEKNIS